MEPQQEKKKSHITNPVPYLSSVILAPICSGDHNNTLRKQSSTGCANPHTRESLPDSISKQCATMCCCLTCRCTILERSLRNLLTASHGLKRLFPSELVFDASVGSREACRQLLMLITLTPRAVYWENMQKDCESCKSGPHDHMDRRTICNLRAVFDIWIVGQRVAAFGDLSKRMTWIKKI